MSVRILVIFNPSVLVLLWKVLSPALSPSVEKEKLLCYELVWQW